MAQNENDIIHVYNLYYLKLDGRRPVAIPFSSLQKLQLHALGIVMKNDKLEGRFKHAIELYLSQGTTDMGGNVQRALETFRKAQVGNDVPLDFDLWWDEEPQVLL